MAKRKSRASRKQNKARAAQTGDRPPPGGGVGSESAARSSAGSSPRAGESTKGRGGTGRGSRRSSQAASTESEGKPVVVKVALGAVFILLVVMGLSFLRKA